MSVDPIPYVALGEQSQQVKARLLQSVERVIDSGNYILGPEVQAFEREFAAYCQVPFAVGVSNGTCSLRMIFQALGIGQGDEVITAPNSFIASASTVAMVGATPVFADIGPDLNIDPACVEAAISPRTKAILPVHLTGRPAQMDAIMALAKKHHLAVVEDAAQAVGARYKGKPVGSLAPIASFSLHPLKNLYAFGDAGMVTATDESFVHAMQKARNHGFKNRNECEFWSCNCRLDEIQAAMLRVQLSSLGPWIEKRRALAERYHQALQDVVRVPREGPDEHCCYQTYVIRAERRDQLLEHLAAQGVEAKIHYPIPIHMQRAASELGYTAEDFPQTMQASREILSLPLYPTLREAQQDRVVSLIRQFYGR